MRRFLLLFSLCLLLAGCAGQSAPVPETMVPAGPAIPEETLPEVTEAAEPVDSIRMLLHAMTTEEKVGQLFLARCPGETALEEIGTYFPGGYILFGQDFDSETPERFSEKIQNWQLASPIPLLIAVDEEGGSVCRVSSHPSFRSQRFPAPRDSFATGGMEAVLEMEREKARLLSGLGINVNMAPVCDIATEPQAFLYHRSLGEDPGETARFVSSTVQIYSDHKLGSVLKHFPGYGNNTDTHTGIAVDPRSLAELETADLIPFASGISAGADAILVSHTIIEAMDGKMPASLSPDVHHYLRDAMGFDGVIVTDDLVMKAITDCYGAEEAAVLAVLAGNDLLCSTEYRIQYDAVLQAVDHGRISMDRLDASVLRILRWKRELGLIF